MTELPFKGIQAVRIECFLFMLKVANTRCFIQIKCSKSLVLTIFEICAKNDTEIHTVCIPWIPREQNTQADYLSRIIDIDDWAISTGFLQFIDELWGPHRVDRFASSNNAKTKLFNSLYWNSCALGGMYLTPL
jgi:hypothetical protein